MKLCKDCKHYSETEDSYSDITYWCLAQAETERCPITGDTRCDGIASCSYMRANDCGQEGKLFEKKRWWGFWA